MMHNFYFWDISCNYISILFLILLNNNIINIYKITSLTFLLFMTILSILSILVSYFFFSVSFETQECAYLRKM